MPIRTGNYTVPLRYSVEKVITSVTALARLGEAYTFDTRLAYTGTLDADSVLHGDLFLIGGFDPEFMEDDLDDLVGAVLRAGIRTVEGKLVADVSVMDSVYWGSGWAWDDAQYSFQPYLSPLMLNRGCVSISVKPTQRGHRPEVETVPESDYYAIDNRAVCHRSRIGLLCDRQSCRMPYPSLREVKNRTRLDAQR